MEYMFERLFLEAEKKTFIFRLFFITLLMTVILGGLNHFIGGNSLFLVALLSLALSYPVVNYVRSMNHEELTMHLKPPALFRRHWRELAVFWTIFIAAVFGMYLVHPLVTDYTFQEAFLQGISGYITHYDSFFTTVLVNNLLVTFYTFVISALFFSGLLFVLLWNASITTYYLTTLGSHQTALGHSFLLLGHGLLEVGGFVLAGIAGALLAYRIDKGKHVSKSFDKTFIRDFAMVISLSLLFILVAAVIETV